MLFVVNVLVFNGGTTFLLRMCRALSNQGVRPGVLILFSQVDKKSLEKIKKYADVYYLKDYLHFPFYAFSKNPITTFLPVVFEKIKGLFNKYDNNIHVMGVFGLLFIDRFRLRMKGSLFLSLGIYHQNEFMFNSRQYYFIEILRKIFSMMPPEAIIFFNEHSMESYSKFFGRNFTCSPLLPVGIDRPAYDASLLVGKNSTKIISIGNLYKFKTYNRHIIELLPLLKKKKEDLEYHIYGVGENESFLRDLAKEKGVEASVFFHGFIDYEKMPEVVSSAYLFVGSGTALVEAAIMGVPSIVGIESIEFPKTYGFIFETKGYTYHELDYKKQMFSIEEKINEIILNEEKWNEYSNKCKLRAEDFLIDKTLQGFINVQNNDKVRVREKHLTYSSGMMLLSFILCGVKSLFNIDRSFIDRRNQGTIN